MTYHPIQSYGVIGDMNSAALVSIDGSIDWACFPRFDSPSVFAAIVDHAKGGRFKIAPVEPATSEHRYRDETTILETTFANREGRVTVVDFMVSAAGHRVETPHRIVRLVRGVAGAVRMRASFEPRLDYARGATTLTAVPQGVRAQHGATDLWLVSDVALGMEAAADGGPRATAEFEVGEGQSVAFIVAYGAEPSVRASPTEIEDEIRRTEDMCREIVSRIRYDGRWRDLVVRSVLTLHMLTYDPTGAIVAAPTTSLPACIAGTRNWDYRYTWLRDAAWTVGVLYRFGEAREGEEYMEWVIAQCALSVERMQILYGITGDSMLEEHELDHLEGYRRSRPVRIGNGAAYHRQLDVFGEIAFSIATYQKHVGPIPEGWWDLVERVAGLAARMWRQPDNGMWEVRGPQQHFVSSKLMCWLALDRASKLGERLGRPDRVRQWRQEADVIRASILANGWSERKRSFVQRYGADNLDASVLLVPFIGFLSPDDPRIASTVRAVQRELADGPFVHRYLIHETDDGLRQSEGAFFMLSFWLAGALATIGAHDEAMDLCERTVAKVSPLGLFAEMWDPIGGEALGNFPQALSHIGFLHTARNLAATVKGDEMLG